MSTERATLLANCLDAPADDTARSVYADFLREQDDPATQALGRFVWAGVTLGRYRGNEPVEDGMFFDAQRELHETAPGVLARQVSHLLGWRWADVMWDQVSSVYVDWLQAANHRGDTIAIPLQGTQRARQRHRDHWPAATYERGMLTALRLTLGEWRRVAPAVLAVCPLERVEILDVPNLRIDVTGPAGGWRVVATRSFGRMAFFAHNAALPPATVYFAEPASPGGLTRASLVEQIDSLTVLAISGVGRNSGPRWADWRDCLYADAPGEEGDRLEELLAQAPDATELNALIDQINGVNDDEEL